MNSERTFYCVRPYAFPERAKIRQVIEDHGLTVREMGVSWLDADDIDALYGHERPSPYFDACREFMTHGLVEFGIVEGRDAIASLVALAGSHFIPNENADDTLRARFGKAEPIDFNGFAYYLNPIHRSCNPQEAARDIALHRRLKERPVPQTLARMMLQLHVDRKLEPVFHSHLAKVVCIARDLCAEYGGDAEVVELACWLHDIYSLKMGDKADHHIHGASEAATILRYLGCREATIDAVQHCIRSHRGALPGEPMTLEAQIVCTADAVANIRYVALLFYFAYRVKGLEFEEGVQSVQRKIARQYEKIPAAFKLKAEVYMAR